MAKGDLVSVLQVVLTPAYPAARPSHASAVGLCGDSRGERHDRTRLTVGGVSDRSEETSHVYRSQGQVLAGLGDRIQRLRDARGLDEQGLANRAGVEEQALRGIESGESTPTLEVLAQLAAGLEVALAELFTDVKPGPAAVVMRANEVVVTDVGGMSVQVLTPRAVAPGLYAARYRIAPGGDGQQPAKHVGHDWLYVLSGELHVDFGQDSVNLREGDSVSFSAQVPHRLSAVGSRPAEFLSVGATPFDGVTSARGGS